jgi:hypothetical protein
MKVSIKYNYLQKFSDLDTQSGLSGVKRWLITIEVVAIKWIEKIIEMGVRAEKIFFFKEERLLSAELRKHHSLIMIHWFKIN